MSNPVNLAARVSWRNLVEVLGIAPDLEAPPCRSACPSCLANSLTTYQDTTYGGQWHICPCGFSGDSIELTAASLGGSIDFALDYLTDKSCLASVAETDVIDYMARFVDKRQAINKLWAEGRSMMESGIFRAWLNCDSGAVDWDQRAGQFVRLVSRDTVSKVLPVRTAKWSEYPERWLEAAIMPFYDLPGRISAFLVMARPMNMASVTSFAYVSAGPLADPPGAAMWVKPPELVFLDPIMAISLQTKHLRSSTGYLPVAVCWPGASPPPLLVSQASGRAYVWSRAMTPDAVKFAKTLSARLTTKDGDIPVDERLAHLPIPQSWLRLAKADSLPWLQAVSRYIETVRGRTLEDFVERLQLSGNERGRLLKSSTAAVRDRLKAVAEKPKHAASDGKTVVEQDGCWLTTDGELVANASLIIETIVARQGDPNLWYQGKIHSKQGDVQFLVPQKELNSDPFGFMQRQLIGTKAFLFDERWRRRAVNVAMTLKTPATVELPAGPGWDEKRERFLLPKFAIGRAGVDLSLAGMFENSSPAAALRPPISLVPEQLSQLAACWPILTFIVYSLVQRAVSGQAVRRPKLLVLPVASPAFKLAAAAGCRQGRPEKSDGDWPAISPSSKKVLDSPDCLLAEAPSHAADVGATYPEVFVLHRSPVTARPSALSACAAFVPDFLQYFVTQRLGHGLWGESLWSRVVTELESYISARGGEPAELELRDIAPPLTDTAAAFARLVAGLYASRKLEVAAGEFVGSTDGKIVATAFREEKAIWIPCDSFCRQVSSAVGAGPDIDNITQALKAGGQLLEEREIGRENGWLLPILWWSQTLSAASRKFSVVAAK